MLNQEWMDAVAGFLAHERAGGKRTQTNQQRRHLYAHTKDLLMVQGMLGHASPTTTRRYVAYGLDAARSVLDELAG